MRPIRRLYLVTFSNFPKIERQQTYPGHELQRWKLGVLTTGYTIVTSLWRLRTDSTDFHVSRPVIDWSSPSMAHFWLIFTFYGLFWPISSFHGPFLTDLQVSTIFEFFSRFICTTLGVINLYIFLNSFFKRAGPKKKSISYFSIRGYINQKSYLTPITFSTTFRSQMKFPFDAK